MSQIKKEPAPSANDTSSKVNPITTIVPEIPANVNPCDEVSEENFCCEVTGDTDMEAYLADREKFLAAKECVLPNAILKVLMEKMEELKRKIAAAQSDIKTWTREILEISGFIVDNSIKTSKEGRE